MFFQTHIRRRHAPALPDIVPDLNDTSNTQSVAHFDGTPVGFDNSV
jgi:hypothetical protein